MAASSTKLPAPFGKYLLTDLIAVGGMAEVYRAKIFGASGFEKEMVVKRILPKYAQNPNFVQMLIDEAKIAVSLTHGNIVPVYELGEFERSYYIAMEYVEGRTVLDVLRDAHSKRRPLAWAYCLGLGAEVARGLDYAHSKADNEGKPLGLVHRDINPRNIVITPSGEVKILDFGIARASTKRHQTASGVIKGTPGYMSPEQMYAEPVDSRSDIYCLGILVYELLTLRRLFPVWDVAEMRQVFEAGPIPKPSSLVNHVDPIVDVVIGKALMQDLSKRFQSAGEFEEELRKAIAKSGIAVTASGLAREIREIDAAPGPRAPRTAPPIPGSAKTAAERTGAGSQPIVDEQTDDLPERVPLKTEPMQQPQPAALAVDAAHSFVISLAGGESSPPAGLPLPSTSLDSAQAGGRTQVFAQNIGINWAAKIGDDAELLALMKVTGSAPGAARRALFATIGLTVVGLAVLFYFAGGEVTSTIKRAFAGAKQELGVLIIKTTPSGAEVVLDGRTAGKTNMKITNIDVALPHRLVLRPPEGAPIEISIARDQFGKGEDGLPTMLIEREIAPKKR